MSQRRGQNEKQMNVTREKEQAFKEALAHVQDAMAAEKCRACGCFHNLLLALEKALPEVDGPEELRKMTLAAKLCLTEQSYDCLGCEVCLPPLVLNALTLALGEAVSDLEVCPAEKAVERQGWPPLPGAYQVLRYQAPVAVCTLTSRDLAEAVAREAGPEIAVVGTLHTENLGIERLIQNVLVNPYLRFVIVCGPDSQQVVGHYPGQSLVAVARRGVDERQRIIGAQGRRPLLKNLGPEAVAHFREVVEVIDLLGEVEAMAVISEAKQCAARNPGPARPFASGRVVEPVSGYLPSRLVSDPAGYFVVYVDRDRGILSLEHYRNDGLLDTVIEGNTAAEIYTPAIDQELISRLDHAAYLGRELARAEHSLKTGEFFVQDAAPELAPLDTLTSITCRPSCQEGGA
jgi:tetrahydromethanopterin S-methyltransferase subunit A